MGGIVPDQIIDSDGGKRNFLPDLTSGQMWSMFAREESSDSFLEQRRSEKAGMPTGITDAPCRYKLPESNFPQHSPVKLVP
jgi:hypothetical protein